MLSREEFIFCFISAIVFFPLNVGGTAACISASGNTTEEKQKWVTHGREIDEREEMGPRSEAGKGIRWDHAESVLRNRREVRVHPPPHTHIHTHGGGRAAMVVGT